MKSIFEFDTEESIEKFTFDFEQEELIYAMLQCPFDIREYLESIKGNQAIIHKKERRQYSKIIVRWFNSNPLVISNNYELRNIPLIGDLIESSKEVVINFNPLCEEFLTALVESYSDYRNSHSYLDKIEVKSKYTGRMLKYLIDNNFVTNVQMDLGELSDLLKVRKTSYPSLRIIEAKIIENVVKQFSELGIEFKFVRMPRGYSRYGVMSFDYRGFCELREIASQEAVLN